MLAYILGLVRHVLTTGGGYFAASSDDTERLLAAVVALAGIVWSIVDKYMTAKANE